jgi:DNA invertase Pin-like site-specific DNA recombinase
MISAFCAAARPAASGASWSLKASRSGRVFVERGVSGSTHLNERPQGAALLAVLEPGDVVVTAKLDRMFRSALDELDVLAQLKECGISLHMVDLGGDVTGNGIAKLVFTILSAVAEAERDRIRERVRDVKRDQKGRNRFLGGMVPFGMELAEDGSLVPDPIAQAAVVAYGKPAQPVAACASAPRWSVIAIGSRFRT